MQHFLNVEGSIIKGILVIFLLCLPTWLMAQNDAQMQHMMAQARKAQACMEKIDRAALHDMASQAEQMEAEIKSLCAAGKRSQAQNSGMKYALDMSQSTVAKDMRRCSELMSGALAGMGSSVMQGMGFPDVDKMKSTHICDAY